MADLNKLGHKLLAFGNNDSLSSTNATDWKELILTDMKEFKGVLGIDSKMFNLLQLEWRRRIASFEDTIKTEQDKLIEEFTQAPIDQLFNVNDIT